MILACVPFRRVLIIILGGGVPPGPENPLPYFRPKYLTYYTHFRPDSINIYPISDLTPKCNTIFQTYFRDLFLLHQFPPCFFPFAVHCPLRHISIKIIPYPRPKRQNLYPISDLKCLKTIPFGVAHTYMA